MADEPLDGPQQRVGVVHLRLDVDVLGRVPVGRRHGDEPARRRA